MIHQLRIYEISDYNKAAFHDRFRDHDLISDQNSKTG